MLDKDNCILVDKGKPSERVGRKATGPLQEESWAAGQRRENPYLSEAGIFVVGRKIDILNSMERG